MDLTTLPDDELLQVLGYLDTKELLQCRGVCRRLRDAALHPDLWRKRSLPSKCNYSDVPLLSAALRLAPCLGKLVLVLGLDIGYPEDLGALLASTSCAISELKVVFMQPSDTAFIASVLARQAVLGRLNSVQLRFIEGIAPDGLIDQLLHTQGLTSLHLFVDDPDPVDSQWAAGDPVPASLQRLDYKWRSDPLSSLLQWHAATLQVVHLLWPMQLPAGTAALFGALPNLRELKCPVLEDMPALLQCPALAELHLDVPDGKKMTGSSLFSAQQYLRKAVADRLETLTLDFTQERGCEVSADAAYLVLGLAGTGSGAPSALRSLRLTYNQGWDVQDPQLLLQPLASVLPRLGNLVSLDLGGPLTDEFLEAMDGQVLPRLERLRVCWVHRSGAGCPHKWAHGQEVRGLLMRYHPRLHLELESWHNRPCFYCRVKSCHDFRFKKIHYLFSHPEHDGQCNLKHCGNDLRIVL